MDDLLKQFAQAGYKTEYRDPNGSDGTASGIVWALGKLNDHPDTAETYSGNAASNLEARLFAAYLTRCQAFINQGELEKAKIEYNKAAEVVGLSIQCHGCTPTLNSTDAQFIMFTIGNRLTDAGVTFDAD